MSRALLLVLVIVAPAVAVEVEQRTCTPPSCGVLGAPHLAADGGRVLVRSTCDLEPGRNLRGRQQLFLLADGGARQLSRGIGPRCALDFTADAALDRIVAVVSCDRPLRSRLFESRGGGRLRPRGPWVPCDVRLEAGGLAGDGRTVVVNADCHPGRGTPLRRTPQSFVAGASGFVPVPQRRCRTLFPSLDGDGGALAFVGDCDLAGENPDGLFQLFHYDRRRRVATQVSHVAAYFRCGFSEPNGVGLFVVPSISADGGTVAVAHDCVAPVVDENAPTALFRWRAATGVEQLTHDYCVDRPAGNDGSLGLSVVLPPIGLSADGAVTAFVMACGIVGPSGANDVRVFLQQDGASPPVREVAGYSRPAGVLGASGVSLTPDGGTLAFASDGPVGGCPSNGARQVYVLRDLATPGQTSARCACGP